MAARRTCAQHERMHRIAMITGGSDENDPDTQANALHFCKRCINWAGPSAGTCGSIIAGAWATPKHSQYAAELAALAPDSHPRRQHIVWGPVAATRSVPIVFVNVADPVGAGFVDSLSRPGGNATGFMQFEYSLSGKWLEVLKQIAPSVTRAAVLRDADVPSGIGQFAVIQSVAPSVGLEVKPINIRDAAEMEDAIAAFARSPPGGWW